MKTTILKVLLYYQLSESKLLQKWTVIPLICHSGNKYWKNNYFILLNKWMDHDRDSLIDLESRLKSASTFSEFLDTHVRKTDIFDSVRSRIVFLLLLLLFIITSSWLIICEKLLQSFPLLLTLWHSVK